VHLYKMAQNKKRKLSELHQIPPPPIPSSFYGFEDKTEEKKFVTASGQINDKNKVGINYYLEDSKEFFLMTVMQMRYAMAHVGVPIVDLNELPPEAPKQPPYPQHIVRQDPYVLNESNPSTLGGLFDVKNSIGYKRSQIDFDDNSNDGHLSDQSDSDNEMKDCDYY
jgi:hypothetical protein